MMEYVFFTKTGVTVLISHYDSVVGSHLSEEFWQKDYKEECFSTDAG